MNTEVRNPGFAPSRITRSSLQIAGSAVALHPGSGAVSLERLLRRRPVLVLRHEAGALSFARVADPDFAVRMHAAAAGGDVVAGPRIPMPAEC